MQTVQLAGNNIGGLVQGNFGNYNPGTDGTYTVDTRDVAALLVAGMSYLSKTGSQYVVTAPAVAAVGQIVASAALSAGSLAIANQPDVMRQVAIRVDPGTLPITAGSIGVTYIGNDGRSHTEVVVVTTPASVLLTKFLSYGVAQISTPTVSAITGGVTPHVQFDTNAALAVPVSPNAVDFAIGLELVGSTAETATIAASTGCFFPATAPNATHSYTVNYTYSAPTV